MAPGLISRILLTAFGFHLTTSVFAGVYIEQNCFSQTLIDECIASGSIKSIYLYDKIEKSDLDKIVSIATQLPLEKSFPKVILNSDGGNLSAAMSIGRLLRLRQASVETHDIFDPTKTPMCYSACVLVAAGAIERNLDTIGLHSGYLKKRTKGEKFEPTELNPATIELVNSYYKEMGINPEIIEIEKNTPFNKMTFFDFELEAPLERQKIYQLGFRMRGSDARDVERLGVRARIKKESTGSLDDLASRNDPEAQYQLGFNMLHGINGWQKSTHRGLAWLNKAADQGQTVALHTLAVTYAFGYEGVEINKKTAYEYYLRAAKLGHAGSQNNLGWAYYKGDGVDKNLFEAIYWITKATDSGDYFSYGSLGAIRLQTDVFVRDDVETYKWLKLGTDLMPAGNSKVEDLKSLDEVRSRMTVSQVQQAEQLVKNWKPLFQSENQMRDKDD